MRMMWAARLVATAVLAVTGTLAVILASTPVRADTVPPFRGNDTGGIIAFPLTQETDIRSLAINHCAQYGKVVKFLAVEPHYGGYISFACRWVPYGALDRPVRARY